MKKKGTIALVDGLRLNKIPFLIGELEVVLTEWVFKVLLMQFERGYNDDFDF